MLIESSGNSKKSQQPQDVLSMDDSLGNSDDPFGQKLFSFQQDGDVFEPVVVGRSALQSMQPGEVIVAKWPPPLTYQYFRNLLPDTSVTKCETCNKMFHTDDYELQLLQKGHCPFCRAPAVFNSTGANNRMSSAASTDMN